MQILCSVSWLLVFRTQILVCGVLCSVDDKGERCTISGKINLSLFTINRNAPHLCERLFVAVRTGLEPATPCVTGMYSNQAELPHHSFGVYFPFGIANVRIIFDCANIIRHFFLFFHSIMLIEEYLSCNRQAIPPETAPLARLVRPVLLVRLTPLALLVRLVRLVRLGWQLLYLWWQLLLLWR